MLGIPKNGTHTLEMYKSGTIDEGKTHQFPLRIAFIREPFDRWLSAFFFMATTGYLLDGVRLSSYDQFVDLALVSDDEHLTPQSRFIDGSFVNKIMCLKSMSDVLGRLSDVKITKENAAPREDIDTSYRKDEVMMRYQADTEMYNRLVA
ncbi:MAG: hypothetical protein JKY52_09395 [Flavobacteriales bacterium]|nr:hypothetical protein [Flavobacteriales bacterium]